MLKKPGSFFSRGGGNKEDRTRVNFRIRVPEVRLIGSDGEQLGIMATRRAISLAEEEGLDLVEVAPTAKPPVCRIMDYGKYKYEQDKKKREAKKKQTVIKLKEIKIRPSTDQHDLEVKVRHVRSFLEDGNKAKITVFFRGRELAHKDLGMVIMKQFLEQVGPIGKIDQEPKFEGRMLTAVLAPNPGGKGHAKAQDKAGSQKAL